MKWISVKDKLPQLYGNYIVYDTEFHFVTSSMFDNESNKFLLDNGCCNSVLRFNEYISHWMEFPKPPSKVPKTKSTCPNDKPKMDLVKKSVCCVSHLNEWWNEQASNY